MIWNLISIVIGLIKGQQKPDIMANLTNNSNPFNSVWIDILLSYYASIIIYNDLAANFHWRHFFTSLDPLQTIGLLTGLAVVKLGHHYVAGKK